MDVLEKQILAVNCGIEWPCLRSCSENYDGCPEGWTKLEEMCVAPTAYAGDCDHLVNISGMLQAQKKAFGLKCAAPFPCLGNTSAHSESVIDVPESPLDGPIDSRTREVFAK
jgi:CPW-WPC domain-containing protein